MATPLSIGTTSVYNSFLLEQLESNEILLPLAFVKSHKVNFLFLVCMRQFSLVFFIISSERAKQLLMVSQLIHTFSFPIEFVISALWLVLHCTVVQQTVVMKVTRPLPSLKELTSPDLCIISTEHATTAASPSKPACSCDKCLRFVVLWPEVNLHEAF